MEFYIMEEDIEKGRLELELDSIPESINMKVIQENKLQFLTRESEIISLTKRSEFGQDLCDYHLPLFSDKLKQILDKKDIRNIFYKPVYLESYDKKEKQLYWLSIVDRIDCINFENSEIDEDLKTIKKFEILESQVGNYKIFKIYGVTDQFHIVTEDLKAELEKNDLKCIKFTNVRDYYED